MIHLEPFIDAAIVSLRNGLPAAIAAENTKHTDFQLPAIAPERVLFGGEETGTILAYPAVEVAAPDADLTGFSLGQQDWDLSITVVVRVWVQNDAVVRGFQALYRASLRYGLAAINVLVAPDSFGDHSTIQRIQSRYRVNPQTGERADFTAAMLLIFTLDDVEGPG